LPKSAQRSATTFAAQAFVTATIKPETKVLPFDGTTLAYRESGDPRAETIVLLHGYLGSSLSWRHQFEPFAERYRVLALDWFGWGASGRSLSLAFDYDTEVDRMRRVFDALGVARANVFAHDYGGFLALGLCQRHPAYFRRLALLNSRAHGSFNRRWRAMFAAITTMARIAPALLEKLPLYAVHALSVRRELKRGVFDDACLRYSSGWMDEPEGKRFYARFFAGYEVKIRPELARALPAIACPVGIVWSRVNPYLPATTPIELADRISGAVLTLLESGHFIMEERPTEVHAALTALLAL
jgi:pimeloyl-ACP methyl ester carboxylesterase